MIPPGLAAQLDQRMAEADAEIDALALALRARMAAAGETQAMADMAAYLARDQLCFLVLGSLRRAATTTTDRTEGNDDASSSDRP